MAQRQFRTDDTSPWPDRYGSGADGALTISADTTDSTANTSITGTAAGTSATAGSGTGFAAGNLILIHQTQGTGVGNWELNRITSVGAGTNWTLAYNLMNTYGTGAQVILLKQYTNVTINSTKTLTASSWNGTKGGILALLVNGTTTINGAINAAGGSASNGTRTTGVGFLGGNPPSSTDAQQGEGTTGAGINSSVNNGNGGGGSADNSSSGGGGAGGGNGSAGTGTAAATAGATSGNTVLTSMTFGGAGGGGAVKGGGGETSGAGGSGGGIVIIISRILTINASTGSINGNGGNGGNTVSTGSQTGSGGGGAGGSILIKAQLATIGTNLITATGGSGGNGFSHLGGAGGDGRIHIDYSSMLSGTTNSPTLDTLQDNVLLDTSPILFFLT